MTTQQFVDAFKAAQKKEPNFLDCAGYNTGLIVQHMLDTAPQFNQTDFHTALMQMSGKTTTLMGPFEINANGAQLGEPFPVAQLQPKAGKLDVVVLYPADKATGKAVYPAPKP
jgi:branched-chain amino acid transport system substrate-binding protein